MGKLAAVVKRRPKAEAGRSGTRARAEHAFCPRRSRVGTTLNFHAFTLRLHSTIVACEAIVTHSQNCQSNARGPPPA